MRDRGSLRITPRAFGRRKVWSMVDAVSIVVMRKKLKFCTKIIQLGSEVRGQIAELRSLRKVARAFTSAV
jgi:hypothetical protein